MVQFTEIEEAKIKQLITLGLTRESAEELVVSQRKPIKTIVDPIQTIADFEANEYRKMFDNIKEKIAVTTFAQLKEYAKGNVIRLPDFAENQPFFARVCRPSMLDLAKNGIIPNNILNAANELFSGGETNTNNPDMMKEIYDVMRVICEASLIEPTLAEIENAGLNLTDEQMIFLFNYSQTGAKSLETFR